ncbi:hypothetical protein ACFX2I_047015 [Malus domestica]
MYKLDVRINKEPAAISPTKVFDIVMVVDPEAYTYDDEWIKGAEAMRKSRLVDISMRKEEIRSQEGRVEEQKGFLKNLNFRNSKEFWKFKGLELVKGALLKRLSGDYIEEQGLSLLLAMILKALWPHPYYDSDDEYVPGGFHS